ncbi:hypothetical protein D3C86_1463620 [compost metagenome]
MATLREMLVVFKELVRCLDLHAFKVKGREDGGFFINNEELVVAGPIFRNRELEVAFVLLLVMPQTLRGARHRNAPTGRVGVVVSDVDPLGHDRVIVLDVVADYGSDWLLVREHAVHERVMHLRDPTLTQELVYLHPGNTGVVVYFVRHVERQRPSLVQLINRQRAVVLDVEVDVRHFTDQWQPTRLFVVVARGTFQNPHGHVISGAHTEEDLDPPCDQECIITVVGQSFIKQVACDHHHVNLS